MVGVRTRLSIGLLVVVLAVVAGGIAYVWHEVSGIEFPTDQATGRPGPVNERTIFASLREHVPGRERRPGVAYRCRAVSPGRRYACVTPGYGGGDRRYRVVVDDEACWVARRAGAAPVDGCAWVGEPDD